MVLTIDIGNTNIVLGCFNGDKLILSSRLFTDTNRTEDQYAIEVRDIFNLNRISAEDIKGCIISSVVPKLSSVLKRAIEKYVKCKILTVSAGIKTGLNIKAENPAAVGSDFVCGAVGAMVKYKLPCVVIDMGTATKIFAVDESGSFIGGSILPGVIISLEALGSKTAQLPIIGLDGAEPNLITTDTVESMRSGILYGNAGMVDGMIERYAAQFKTKPTFIATGGIAPSIVKYCKSDIVLDDTIVLDGLYAIYKKNA